MIGEGNFQKIIYHQKIENEQEADPVLLELIERIKELEYHENVIGEGATAKVFASKTNPDICYKIIRSNGEYDFRNSVDVEADILEKAEKISRSCQVKVPKPYYSIVTKGAKHFEVLVMERMHALSVREILEGNLDVDENFNFQEFAAKVDNFFAKLHDNNIFHRDAHWGNIMIEDGTNIPCVIDFGASTELLISSEDPYKQINFNNEAVAFTKDEYKVREELRVKLRTYLFKKYGNIHNL